MNILLLITGVMPLGCVLLDFRVVAEGAAAGDTTSAKADWRWRPRNLTFPRGNVVIGSRRFLVQTAGFPITTYLRGISLEISRAKRTRSKGFDGDVDSTAVVGQLRVVAWVAIEGAELVHLELDLSRIDEHEVVGSAGRRALRTAAIDGDDVGVVGASGIGMVDER